MWETPFDPSMLDGSVLILCPDSDLAPELMDLLGAYGVKWDLRRRVASRDEVHLAANGMTCYRVCDKSMGYSDKEYYEMSASYKYYTRCTFYGVSTQDFEAATDEEIFSLFRT